MPMFFEYAQIAENKATNILRKEQYTVLARNRRFYGVEIDIITKKGDAYTFFEVKRVKQNHYHSLFPAISYRQQSRYQHSITTWYADIQKFLTVSIGLLVFDEKMKLLEFNKNLLSQSTQ